jgi:hypothetical protein
MRTGTRLFGLLLLLALLPMLGCSRGDYLGPAERTARALGNGWDMWSTASVQPHELPMPGTVAGTVPINGKPGYAAALQQLQQMPPSERTARAALVYRRYCYHCHGASGDGRIIVGESFDLPPTDLRSPVVQAKSDEQHYERVANGSPVMIPLRDTVAPVEILLAIAHARTLANAPSQPYFPPQSAEPPR